MRSARRTLERYRTWLRRRPLRRRLRAIEAGLLASLDHPERRREICANLGITHEFMAALLDAVQPDIRGDRDDLRLHRLGIPADVPVAHVAQDVESWIIPQREGATKVEMVAARVRRAILLLLDLPFAQRDPTFAADFITQLTDSAAEGDLCGLDRLCTTLAWLGRAGASVSKSGARIQQSTQETVLDARARNEDFFAEHALRTQEEAGAGMPADLPVHEARNWVAARALLETLAGDPRLRRELATELSYLDSIQRDIDLGTAPRGAIADVLVLVRTRVRRLVLTLGERASLTADLVTAACDTIAGSPDEAMPDLLWSLEQGQDERVRVQAGQSLPQGVDVAWAQLVRAAAAFPGDRSGPGPRIESRPTQPHEAISIDAYALPRWKVLAQYAISKLMMAVLMVNYDILLKSFLSGEFDASHSFVDSQFSRDERFPEEERFSPPPSIALAESSGADHELNLRLIGAVCRDHGSLTWDTCLALANSRAGFHRYTEAESGTPWQVRLAARPALGGAIEICYAVVEQPLSARFRRHFDAADLPGRVRILWQLVDYAARLHVSILNLTTRDTRRQLELREEELWTILAGGHPERSPIARQGEDG